MAKKTNLMAKKTDQNKEQLELSYIADGNSNNPFGRQFGNFL